MATTFTYSVPASCEGLFRDAGWRPGRHFSCQVKGVYHIPAALGGLQLLSEFGGLTVGKCGRGQQCATSDIQFAIGDTFVDFDLWREVEKLAGESLFPIGSASREDGELFVYARGLMYMHGNPDGSLYLVGDPFEDALERLLLGRHPLRQIATR